MFVGTMAYLRVWFDKDKYAVTLGGGLMNNPGRYLTLLPPIDGANAISGSPYYTENAGDRAQMHDGTITFDYMPASSSPSAWRPATGTPTRHTGPATAASHLPAATTDLRRNMHVQAALPPAMDTAILA